MSTTAGAVRGTDAELTSQAVVSAVARETGADPTSLEPLYEVFDPDALDALFEGRESGTVVPSRVEFRYAGCDVCVTADGSVDATAIAD